MEWEKAAKELDRKLDPSNVKPASKYGPKGDYIEGWLAIAEANRIFGHGGWSYEVVRVDRVAEGPRKIGREQKPGFGVTYTAHLRVKVDGVIREVVGAGHGYDTDLGLAHESAIKEAVTDCLKRCLRTFGWPFGLALYDKSREMVGVEEPDGSPPLSEQMGERPKDGEPAPQLTTEEVFKGLQAKLDLCDTWAKFDRVTNFDSFDKALTRLQAEDRPRYMFIVGLVEEMRERLRPPMPDDHLPGLDPEAQLKEAGMPGAFHA